MTLAQFLEAFANGVLVNVVDASNAEIIKFYSGTTAIDSATSARTIRKIEIISALEIKIILNDAPQSEQNDGE